MWLLLQVGIYIQSHSPDILKTVEKLYFVDEQKFIGGFHCYSSHAKWFFNKLHFYNWPPSPSNGQPPSILHFSEPRSEFSVGCNWQLIDYSQLTRWFWPESVCQLVFFCPVLSRQTSLNGFRWPCPTAPCMFYQLYLRICVICLPLS